MKKQIKILCVIMLLLMFCTMHVNVSAEDYGYIEINVDKQIAYDGETLELTVVSIKPVTDFELTFSSENVTEPIQIVSKLQGSASSTKGNTEVIYLAQIGSQADKTVYPVGTELAKVTYKIPTDFWDDNNNGYDIEFNLNVGVKITDNGSNYSYSLTKTVSVINAFYGDVYIDGKIDIVDTVHLNQYIEVTEGVTLDEQALKNADVNNDSNVNGEDLKLLGMYLANFFEDTLPEKPITDYVLYGDVNRDGEITLRDTVELVNYEGITDGGVTLDEQALKNADVNNDGKIDMQDVKLIAMYVTEWFPGTLPEKPITDYVLYGDVSRDGVILLADALILNQYIEGTEGVTLDEQALKNADVNNDGKIDIQDVKLITMHITEWFPETLPENPITDYVLYGDVSCDGIINTKDTSMLWRYLLGIGELSEQGLKNADIDANGKVDYVDVELIRRGHAGNYYEEELPYEAIISHKLHMYNNEWVYELNEDNEAIVVFWPDETKDKYFLPEKLGEYIVVGVEDFPEVEGVTFVLPSTITNILGINSGNTIVTAKRIAIIEDYASKKGITYIVVGETLQESLTKITIDNNVVSNHTTLSQTEIDAGLKAVVRNKDNKILASDEKIGTGSKLQIVDGNENVICEETVSIDGEIDGDGEIGFFDVVELISLVYDTEEDYEWQESVRNAAMFGEEGTPGFFEIVSLISYIYD